MAAPQCSATRGALAHPHHRVESRAYKRGNYHGVPLLLDKRAYQTFGGLPEQRNSVISRGQR